MRQRVVGIGLNCFLEKSDSRFHLWFGILAKAALVGAINAFDIILISDWVRRGTLIETRLLRRVELQPQARSHLVRHRILNREDVGSAHIEVISPQRNSVAHAQKIDAHAQTVTVALDVSVKHRVHV